MEPEQLQEYLSDENIRNLTIYPDGISVTYELDGRTYNIGVRVENERGAPYPYKAQARVLKFGNEECSCSGSGTRFEDAIYSFWNCLRPRLKEAQAQGKEIFSV